MEGLQVIACCRKIKLAKQKTIPNWYSKSKCKSFYNIQRVIFKCSCKVNIIARDVKNLSSFFGSYTFLIIMSPTTPTLITKSMQGCVFTVCVTVCVHFVAEEWMTPKSFTAYFMFGSVT